ncbi:MAG TPA: CrcB family protein [Acidimicrobiales bacterium]|jgi:CrcB protein
MTRIVLVAGAGAVGSWLRWSVATRLGHGTTAVNLLGSFALGLVVAAGGDATTRVVLGTGLCGAFTTFSAFAVEAVEQGRARRVVLDVGGSILAAAAGLALG